MQIWVDSDACPVAIKQILFKASRRTGVVLTLVANHSQSIPSDKSIRLQLVEKGFDVADNFIVKNVVARDIVVTGDIPLAAEVIELGAIAINPRGELYTQETIRSRLNMRDFMEVMRDTGLASGGPAPLGSKEKQRFANHLDTLLAKR